jgi:hypothetical protein
MLQRPSSTSRPLATDQMLPEVSACTLRARSGGKPGELTVTPGEADTAPELGRTSSPGVGRRFPKQPLMRQTREQPSNQMSSNHDRQWGRPADAGGRQLPGQARNSAGSRHRYLASDEEAAGSIRPPRRGFPPANLLSHRLPNLTVVSDFGTRMGATMSAQVRLDAVIVAAGRLLTSPDIGFGHPLPGACMLSS